MRARLPLLSLILLLLLGGTSAYAIIGVALQPPPAPAVQPTPIVSKPLSEHVIMIIVDGLRYDVGTDPARMPHFAQAMKDHSSGEIWAGRISMSSAAIMTYATGQWGGLYQLVFNTSPKTPPFNSWLENAARRDMKATAVGDYIWEKMFGRHLSEFYMDPPSVAMDVDTNPQNFADTRTLIAARPHFIVAQFTTPDHQGHTHGIPSKAYGDHMRAYDEALHELLGELDDAWTVIVTSDHGATDNGSHGSDTPIQRRSPIYVYGRGIQTGVKIKRRLWQPELANTLAALLGVEPPAHSLGHAIVPWLDLSDSERNGVACGEATRAARYAAANSGDDDLEGAAAELCAAEGAWPQKVKRSQRIVEQAAASVGTGFGSARLWWLMLFGVALATAIAVVAYGRIALRAWPLAVVLMIFAVGLTYQVELLPGAYPNIVRAVLFVIVNLITVVAVFSPGRLTMQLRRNPHIAAIVLPGFLLASYTANTQAMSFVVVAACAVYFLLSGHSTDGSKSVFSSGRLLVSPIRVVGVVGCVLLLAFPGTQKSQVWGNWMLSDANRMTVAAALVFTIWSLARGHRAAWNREEKLAVVCGLPVAMAALVARRMATPNLGRFLVAFLAVVALGFALRRRRSLALHFGLASYALLVNREIQMVGVIATLVVAEAVGHAVGDSERGRPTPSTVLMMALFAFGVLYVQRIAVQGGLGIGDFAPAATFGDAAPPWWAISAGVTLRWLIPGLLALAVLLWPCSGALRYEMLRALTVVFAVRVMMLLVIIGCCGESFWTATRSVGDIPFALLYGLAVVMAWLVSQGRGALTAGALTR